MPTEKIRLAVIALHPVQYQIPLWKALALDQGLQTTVFFLNRLNTKPYWDPEFNTTVDFNLPNLSGFTFEFLPNLANKWGKGFMRHLNPALIWKLWQYDVVLVNGYDSFSTVLTIVVAKLTRKKILLRGEATLNQNSSNRATKLKPIILSMYDSVLYSCTGNRQYFERHNVPVKKLFPIPCAVDNDYFNTERSTQTPHRSGIRDELNLSETVFVVIFAARFTSRKRPMDLLMAINQLQSTGLKDVGVVFVGDGPERKKMVSYVAGQQLKNIRFVGFQNQQDICKYYVVGDLGVIISESDPSPKALNEMMNFAMPIVCTDVVGTAYDLVQEGINGHIIKVGDVEMLARRIRELAENRERAREMGQKSLEIVSEWNFEKDVEGIKAAVDYVMSPRGRL